MLWWELLYFVLYYNDMYMFMNTIACIYNDMYMFSEHYSVYLQRHLNMHGYVYIKY